MKVGDTVRVNEGFGQYIGKIGVVIGTDFCIAKYREIGYEESPIVTVRILDTPQQTIELQATADKFDVIFEA